MPTWDPMQSLKQVALVGRTGMGKSSLLEHIAVLHMESEEEYKKRVVEFKVEELEAYKRWL